MKKLTSIKLAPFALASALLFTHTASNAAGFYLIDQSVSSMGTAYAGGSALADDASTLYFNPAGITRLKQTQAIIALNAIQESELQYRDNGSSHLLTGTGGLGSDPSGNAGVSGEVPNLYYVQPINNKLYGGIAINAPFGLATKYSNDWIGRYHAIESKLKTLNISPSLAFDSGDISYGFGIDVQYIEATLSNAIDIGTINALPVNLGGFGGAFNALGLTPGASDGYVQIQGDDWSVGYNVGVLYQANGQTRLGFHYRSSISHSLSGTADFTVPGNGAIETNTQLFNDTSVSSSVKMPSIASLSAHHAFNDQWEIMADLSWTQWSNIKEIRFQFNSAQPDGVTTYNWNNSRRYAVGAAFKPSSKLVYRIGVAYDETPIPSPEFRNPRLPGEDRTWIAFGVGYGISKQLSVDAAFAHLRADDPQINKTATGEDALLGGLSGSYDTSGNTFSVQFKWMFQE